MKRFKTKFNNIESKNVLAFTYAQGGACGNSSTIEILTDKDKIPIKLSNKEQVEKLIPDLLEMKFVFNFVKNVSMNWKHYDMGLGNHLFVHSSINNAFAEKVKNLSTQDIYKNWYNLIIGK